MTNSLTASPALLQEAPQAGPSSDPAFFQSKEGGSGVANIRIGYINVDFFRRGHKALVKELVRQQYDALLMVEASNGNIKTDHQTTDYLGMIAAATGMKHVDLFTIGRRLKDGDRLQRGLSIFSKLPIEGLSVDMFHGKQPELYDERHPLFRNDLTKQEIYPHLQDLPLGILTIAVNVHGTFVKLMTTQFHVSDKCRVTPLIGADARETARIIGELDDGNPMFLIGDFNSQPGSIPIQTIEAAGMKRIGLGIGDTLSDDHPAKRRDFPGGLAVDQGFVKGDSEQIGVVQDLTTQPGDFSDHRLMETTLGITV